MTPQTITEILKKHGVAPAYELVNELHLASKARTTSSKPRSPRQQAHDAEVLKCAAAFCEGARLQIADIPAHLRSNVHTWVVPINQFIKQYNGKSEWAIKEAGRLHAQKRDPRGKPLECKGPISVTYLIGKIGTETARPTVAGPVLG